MVIHEIIHVMKYGGSLPVFFWGELNYEVMYVYNLGDLNLRMHLQQQQKNIDRTATDANAIHVWCI